MTIYLAPITPADLRQYKLDMQEAFRLGAIEGGYPMDDSDPDQDGEILPEADIDRSLATPGAVAYKAVRDGQMVGGAIVVIDGEKHSGHLDFLYVKYGVQSCGIGKFMWFEIERLHPEITTWETCTPYFEKRNLHFYINVCGFHAVEYFNPYHKAPHDPHPTEDNAPDFDGGMFGFRKELKEL